MRALLLCLLLAGCCARQPIQQVPVSCVKTTPQREPSVFASTAIDAPIGEQVNALLVDRDLTDIYVGGLEAIVAGCR